MAGLRKLKGKFYCRVYYMKPNGKSSEKMVPLRTADRKTAVLRRLEVERFEEDIKNGMDFEFPWMTESGQTEVVRYSLADAKADYIKARKAEGLRDKTISMYKLSLSHFLDHLGEETPAETVTTQDIQSFQQALQPDMTKTSINIHLRALKTFFFWLEEHGHIDTPPKIKLLQTNKSLPIYVSNAEFDKIQEQVSPHYQRVFWFYRETGCRLSEPFQGEVNGQFLTIKAETSKTHQERDIYLTPNLLAILTELRTKYENRKVKAKTFRDRYSVHFRRACDKAKITGKKFHSLRHTFAVRTYLKTRDIYKVAKLLGHASVTTTEIYAKFNMRRLEQDFPDLVEDIEQEFHPTAEGRQTHLPAQSQHPIPNKPQYHS